MQKIHLPGKYLFAVAVLAFGIIQIVTKNFLAGPFPFPASFPGRTFFVYFLSALFIIFSFAIILGIAVKRSAISLSIIFSVLWIYPNLILLLQDIHSGGEWTIVGEVGALASGACMLANASQSYIQLYKPNKNALTKTAIAARYILGLTAIIFGVLHAVYRTYIITLIPSWIPFADLWSYVVCIAFFAVAASLLLNIKVKFAMILYACMFFIFVITTHIPRVIAKPDVEPEWTSLFVAVAMIGISLIAAKKIEKK